MILPFITYVPLMAVLSLMVQIKPKKIPGDAHFKAIKKLIKKNKCRKYIHITGFVILFTLLAGTILFMFVLDAN